MNHVTQEQIDEAINNCVFLSQNGPCGDSAIRDICTGMCLPCARVIGSGKCDVIMALFHPELTTKAKIASILSLEEDKK